MEKVLKSKYTYVLISLFFILFTLMVCMFNYKTEYQITTRNIEAQSIDYQSLIDDFDNSSLTVEDNTVKFTGEKSIDESMLSELENLSVSEKESLYINVKYDVDYNIEENIVTLSCTMTKSDGTEAIETYSGVGFYNDAGEIDAVFNMDGEAVYLSEMSDASQISTCGFFSRLFKAIKKVVAIVAVVAAVVAVAAIVVATAGTAVLGVVGVATTVITTTSTVAATIATATATTALIASGIALIADVITNTTTHPYSKTYTPTISISIPQDAVPMTKELIDRLTKKIQLNSTSPYFPAFRYQGKLFVIPISVPLQVALESIKVGADYWSPLPDLARTLAAKASLNGVPLPAEKDKNDKGYYWHYHLTLDGKTRYGGHSFFGVPYLDQY